MPRAGLRELWQAVLAGKRALAAPIIILGGIYGGVFTPTEASVVAVAYGLITGLWIYRGVGYRELYSLILTSMRTTAVVMETPPLGYSLFVGAAVSGLSIEEITKGMLPFFLVDVCMLMLVTFVPWMTLRLPNLILG